MRNLDNMPITIAIQKGDLETVQKLLLDPATRKYIGCNDNQLLLEATQAKHDRQADIFRALLRFSEVLRPALCKLWPFRWALRSNHRNIVFQFLHMRSIYEKRLPVVDLGEFDVKIALRNNDNSVAMHLIKSIWPSGLKDVPETLKSMLPFELKHRLKAYGEREANQASGQNLGRQLLGKFLLSRTEWTIDSIKKLRRSFAEHPHRLNLVNCATSPLTKVAEYLGHDSQTLLCQARQEEGFRIWNACLFSSSRLMNRLHQQSSETQGYDPKPGR